MGEDSYWDRLEAALDRLNAQEESVESDPWAVLDLAAPTLTPEQRATLIDQPSPARLADTSPTKAEPTGEADDDSRRAGPTGKPPGDEGDTLA